MSIGNWKDHIIVNCAACAEPMAYHVETNEATCNDCDRKAYASKIKKSIDVYQDALRLYRSGLLTAHSFNNLVETLDEYTDLIENHGVVDNA